MPVRWRRRPSIRKGVGCAVVVGVMRGVTIAAAAEAPAVVWVAAGRDTRLLQLLEVRCEVAAVLLRSGCVVLLLLLLMLGHSVGVMRVAATVLLAATSA
jgi:hypothetical protein